MTVFTASLVNRKFANKFLEVSFSYVGIFLYRQL